MAGRQRVAGRAPAKEWVKVDRRKTRSSEGWESKLETTFFIENLPEEATNNLLWKSFGKVGRLSNAYIAKKKDSSGNRFGFLRFLNVKDINVILEEANKIQVLEAVIQVSLARFDRNHRKFMHQGGTGAGSNEPKRKPVPPDMGFGQVRGGLENGGRRFQSGGLSYKDVVNNHKLESPVRKSIRITRDGGLLQKHWVGKAVLGEGLNMERLQSARLVLDENGLKEVGILYLGGMKSLVAFHDEKQALEFISEKKQVWGRCFGSVRVWKGESLPVERVVGLKIRGVPVQIREDEVFNEIGGMFGKVVGGSKFSWGCGDGAVGLVHVLVNRWEKVDEIINVVWKEGCFEVKVEEDGSDWSPKVVEHAVLEEGEFRRPSPEETDGSAGEDAGRGAGRSEGEGVGFGNCMHGERGNINGGGSFGNNYNLEGQFGDFEVGSGPVSRKKRKRSGDGNGLAGKGPNSGWEIPVDLGQSENSVGPKGNSEQSAGLGVSMSVGRAEEGNNSGASGEVNQELRSEAVNGEGNPIEVSTASGVDVEMESRGEQDSGEKRGVEMEVEETIKVGQAMGVEIGAFRQEVSDLVNGDGVFEVPK